MNIDSIKNGYVIDHIEPGKSFEIYNYLNLGELDTSVAIIKNAKSNKTGKKDIIKIDENLDINLDILGYLDPKITVNKIKDGKIIEKFHPELPEKLENAKKDLCIMHPLPRVNEIAVEVDDDPRACYFKQAKYGKFIRMALILKLLNFEK